MVGISLESWNEFKRAKELDPYVVNSIAKALNWPPQPFVDQPAPDVATIHEYWHWKLRQDFDSTATVVTLPQSAFPGNDEDVVCQSFQMAAWRATVIHGKELRVVGKNPRKTCRYYRTRIQKLLPEFAKECASGIALVYLPDDILPERIEQQGEGLCGIAIKYAGNYGKEVRIRARLYSPVRESLVPDWS